MTWKIAILTVLILAAMGCQGTLSVGITPGFKKDGHRLTSQVETVKAENKWKGWDAGLTYKKP